MIKGKVVLSPDGPIYPTGYYVVIKLDGPWPKELNNNSIVEIKVCHD